MRNTRDILQELRRRRVFRVVALYIVGAWILIQVADLAFPGLQIPESAIRFVWIGAIIGFPIAAIVGWLFDFSDGRIVRTADLADQQPLPLRRLDYVVLSVLTMSIVAISSGLIIQIFDTRSGDSEQLADSDVNPKSIAVLPFDNISGNDANNPFTLGIHDDLLTHVSKIRDIKVISRTSVARLDKKMSIRDIGKLLGVATVLESGVQRIGNRVRINSQLIDAATDQHLWAETFDRELSTRNIFEIQTEIAAAITEQLRATLSPLDESNLGKLPTESLQAYEAYMLGNQRMAVRTREDLFAAIAYFEQALEADPEYTVAYVGLANANLLLNNYGFISLDAALEVADLAIDTVLEIDDQLGPAYAAKGLASVRQDDYAAAESAFRRAIALDPNHAAAYHWYGDMLLSRLAQPEKAMPLLLRARELDPLSPIIIVTLGEAHEDLGYFDEALALYQRAIEIEPDYSGGYYLIGVHMRSARGRLDEAVQWHRKEFAVDPAREMSILSWNYLDLGDEAKAEFWVDRANRTYPGSFSPVAAKGVLHRYREEETEAVKVARQLMSLAPGNNASLVIFVDFGRYQEALREVAPFYPELSCDKPPTVTRANFSQAINLSLVHEKTGQPDCAEGLLDGVLELFQTMPRFGRRGFAIADVEVYARQGRTNRALAALREAIDAGYRHAWWALGPSSPHMTSLLDDPRFQEMMKEIQSDLAGQLDNVRRMNANGELAPIPNRGGN